MVLINPEIMKKKWIENENMLMQTMAFSHWWLWNGSYWRENEGKNKVEETFMQTMVFWALKKKKKTEFYHSINSGLPS